jgi:MazG family protein
MSLLVVPLAPDEVGLATLGEWDALVARELVVFERADHPLRARLELHGVATASIEPGDGMEPEPAGATVALVADPDSPRVVDLARRGADVAMPAGEVSDALTAAHAAPIARRAGHSLAGLAAIMARLRSEDGCPWDLQQTHRSLQPHLLEEAYEVLDAIESGDAAELAEELGDLLLQVVFHAQMARQERTFDLAAVADGIVAKLLRRHPHVFGDVAVSGASEVVTNWEAIKSDEKRRAGPLEDIPRSLPALLATHKVQKRAARAGFTPDEATARQSLARALEASGEAGVGEALFWVVSVARARGVDPETALRRATRSFVAAMAP